MPRRPRNSDVRTREHLTPEEVDTLIAAAGRLGRQGGRDAALILIAYRHGLRVGELVALRWDQVDLRAGLLHVSRLKGGVPSTHPLRGPELRALRRLRRRYSGSAAYVFTTERGGPLTDSRVRKIVARAGVAAPLPFPLALDPATARTTGGRDGAQPDPARLDSRTPGAYLRRVPPGSGDEEPPIKRDPIPCSSRCCSRWKRVQAAPMVVKRRWL